MLMRMRALEQYYHIEYEDGNHEDLSSKDCSDAIKLQRQIENG